MSAHPPFAGLCPRPSAWGYNWTTAAQEEEPRSPFHRRQVVEREEEEEREREQRQLAHMPVALLGTLKREKKPFTYTPGGVNLSEVLEARLRKRTERKKRYCEERTPRQVVVMPTYNTPLHMYSTENALEALEVQAELADKSSRSGLSVRSSTLPRNHTFRFRNEEEGQEEGSPAAQQSKAFRVLQIITDTEDPEAGHERSGSRHRDEMRFSGIRDSGAIPSRFFHALQKITGTEEEEEEEGTVTRPTSFPPLRQPASAHHQTAQRHPQRDPAVPVLRRPAAFLSDSKGAAPGFRPVRPPNGMQRTAGTDF